MTLHEIDRRIAADTPTQSLRDLLSPVLQTLEKADHIISGDSLTFVRRELRQAFRLARDFECEVSKLRWELRCLHDAKLNAQRKEDEAIIAGLDSNIVLFPGRME